MQAPKSLLCILLLTLVYGLLARAQNKNTDSLYALIGSKAPAAEKVKACIVLSDLLSTKNFDDCISTAVTGYQLALQVNDSAAMSELTKIKGIAYYLKGNYDSAANLYYQALGMARGSADATKRAGILNALGRLYRKTKDLDRALQHYDEALSIYTKLNDQDGMATILNESGVVFEYKQAYAEAASRYKKSLAIREKMHDLVGKAYSLNFLGGVYALQQQFTTAEKYLLESLQLRQQLHDTFSIALSYTDLGAMYLMQGKYEQAIQQYQSSNTIAYQMKYAELLQSNFKELAHAAEQMGNTALSLQYFKQYDILKDSIYSSDKMKQIEALNAQYQSDKKEQQLQLQQAAIQRKNLLLWALVAGTLLLVITGISFYRKRQAQHRLQLQAEVMKQQDLATKGIINAEENERKRIAADLHDGVGQLMSAAKMNLSAFESELPFSNENQKTAFEKVISLVDESCREIRSVSHQMMPNALLKSGLASAVKEFLDKLDSRMLKVNLYTEGLNERLDSNLETVLYRVIQECVNNVIKHSGANTLDISLIKDADGIAATIEDNGKGFDSKDKQRFEGIGIKNISSRIEYLKGTVDFDSQPGRGTLVAIHVPVE